MLLLQQIVRGCGGAPAEWDVIYFSHYLGLWRYTNSYCSGGGVYWRYCLCGWKCVCGGVVGDILLVILVVVVYTFCNHTAMWYISHILAGLQPLDQYARLCAHVYTAIFSMSAFVLFRTWGGGLDPARLCSFFKTLSYPPPSTPIIFVLLHQNHHKNT